MTSEYANEAVWDRVLRTLLGATMIYLGWFVVEAGLVSAALKIFGFVPLATGLLGWCPFYALLGFATNRNRRPG